MGRREFIFVNYSRILDFIYGRINGIFIYPGNKFTTNRPTSTKSTISSNIVIPLTKFRLSRFKIFRANKPIASLIIMTRDSEIIKIRARCVSILCGSTKGTISNDKSSMFVIGTSILNIQFSKIIRIYATFEARTRIPLTRYYDNMTFFLRRVNRDSTNNVSSRFKVTQDGTNVLLSPKVRTYRRTRTKENTNKEDNVDINGLRTLSNGTIGIKDTCFNNAMAARITSTRIVDGRVCCVKLLQEILQDLIFELTSTSHCRNYAKGREPRKKGVLRDSLALSYGSRIGNGEFCKVKYVEGCGKERGGCGPCRTVT